MRERGRRTTTALGGVALALLMVLGVAASFGTQVDPSTQLERSRGQALFEEKRYADAAATFERVVEDPAASAEDWLNLALARYEQSDDPAALEALDEARTLDPRLTGVHYLRGLVAKRNDRAADALEAFRAAHALDEADPAVLYNLAWALEATERADEAQPLYDRIIDMGFDIALQHYASSLYRRGFLQVRAGDREEGQSLLLRSRDAQQRLTQAQRAPAALEAGRHKRILVPAPDLAGPAVTRPAAVAFRAGAAIVSRPALVDWIDGVPAIVSTGAEGTVRTASGANRPLEAPSGQSALGDADRDGHPDLAVASNGRLRLFRSAGADDPATFEPWEATGLPGVERVTSLHWVDADHDGDLDLLLTQAATPGMRIVDNLGGGTFEETTSSAGLAAAAPAAGLVWADFDGDNDTDFFTFGAGSPGHLYTNLRGGRFQDIGAAVGAGGAAGAVAALAEDLDNDGDLDLALAGADGVRLRVNDGDGTFADGGGFGPVDAAALGAADLDNDGWLDLLVSADDSTEWWRNRGALDFESRGPVGEGSLAAVADWNADGGLDVLLTGSDGARWWMQDEPAHRWLRVALAGIKNNPRGRGAKIEVKTEGLYQLRPLRAGVAHFGLGEAESAAVVRITWPNGIIQNELEVPAGGLLGPVTEVERLEGSCPLLYTWDGERWRFINEVLGVAPLGMPLGVDAIHPADFDEYVPVPGEALAERDGFYELRFTEELREAGYLDAIRLIALDRPSGMQLLPDEKFVAPPHPEFRLFAVTEPRPVRAVDQNGVDWTAALRAPDGNWTRPFERDRYEGLATPHSLELSLGDEVRTGQRVRLFLTGWVYWATGSINVVVDEDPRTRFEPVALEVDDGSGDWRTAIADIGLPNAKNSTLAVDLSELVAAGHRRFRLSTTMRLYWDAAWYTADDLHPQGLAPVGDWAGDWGVPHPGPLELVGEPGSPLPRATVLAPSYGSIDYRGFSQLIQGRDGYETFDYAALVATAPWNQHRGAYTRYGDVTELLQQADDRYVVVGTGDEVAVRFAAEGLPALPAGWERHWLVYLNGWVKDGDPNTFAGDRVEPLPFHAMSRYPYGPDEEFPSTPEHRRWLETYNTRPWRSIHSPLAPRGTAPPAGRRE